MPFIVVYGLSQEDRGWDYLGLALKTQTEFLFITCSEKPEDSVRVHIVSQLNSVQSPHLLGATIPRLLTIVVGGIAETSNSQNGLLCPLVGCLTALINEWARKYLPGETVEVEILATTFRPTKDFFSSFTITPSDSP